MDEIRETGIRKVGEIFGIEIWADPKLRPNEARMVSLTYDPLEERMRVKDTVRITNLGHSIRVRNPD